jgi:uncharacterized protein (UPF0335 family)
MHMREPQAGHNVVSKDQIRSIIERIESVEGTIKEFTKDRGEIYQEAKGNGYDVKALRTIVRMRKMDANERSEADMILETYMHALEML